MTLRLVLLTVILAASAQAAPTAEENALAIKQLEAEVAQLKAEIAAMKAAAAPPPELPPPSRSAVSSAIGDLSDCEKQLMSGNTNEVDQRLADARAILRGNTAAFIDAARSSLANGDLGNARGYIAGAIKEAEAAY